MDEIKLKNRCVSSPGLQIKGGSASPTVNYGNSFQFLADGLVSPVVTTADAPNLNLATTLVPNSTVAGVLAGDNGSTNTGIKCCRIYTLVATLPTNDGSTVPTFSWIAGADFTKYEYPALQYVALPNQYNQAAVGFVIVVNKSSGNFTPGTTNLDASNVTTTFIENNVTGSALTSVQTTKVSLTSAQILALNTTPIQVLAAPGTGKVYDIISVYARMNFLTAAYATNTNLQLVDTTTGNALFSDASVILAASATAIAMIPPVVASATVPVGVAITTNGAVSAKAKTGDPATGAGSVDLYITYRVVTL